ncbi:DUF6255 family natural product biosynthesis protein [Streptomyces rectiverticillatus]|uniref:DUF6255 family natural product biosynthesis protein n=1 Tax=Streptomyces rectiverticillatus TaxID=173860 RepID=UPI003CCDB63C
MRGRCTHRGGWAARTRGQACCRDCGTVRFSEYAALRPPGLPEATASPRRAGLAADRVAAQRVSLVTRRGRVRSSGWPAGWG